MDELIKLVEFIQSEYDAITSIAANRINLKRVLVSDIETGNDIYLSVTRYADIVNSHSERIQLQLPPNITARAKTPHSIEYKIQNYKSENHNFGKIPIIKCLNDLFGFRIIMDRPISYERVKEILGDRYKCINSSKMEYKATHVYFKGSNCDFQWELQIWNRCDAENNFASHKKYKQGYTAWEKSIKEGGFVDG